MDRRPRKLLTKLLAGMLAPTAAALLVFGLLAHEVARRTVEDELGRRLAGAATAAAMLILPEQAQELASGDEGSLTVANVRRKLQAARVRLDVRRVLLVSPDLTARLDSDGRIPWGAAAHELGADRVEQQMAAAGRPAASPLFTGHDGLPYKRAWAAIGPTREPAGFIVVEGSADYFVALGSFRRWLLAAGATVLVVVAGAAVLMARRLTRPLQRLAGAAQQIGAGQLDTRVPVETRDEIGLLAGTLDEMRGALRARDERLQMMLAGIAHEVRNPLGGMELYAGLLREALSDSPERLTEVARIERELGYLKAVVTEFLDFARRPPPELAETELLPLLEEVRELAAAPHVAVEAAPGLRARVDRAQLRRALLNLTRNALSAMGQLSRDSRDGHPNRAHVRLSAASTDGVVQLVVEDRGPGVAPELREKIFAPFFTTHEKGTGLGLAFVHDIVRDHGGTVAVDDTPGGGARFTIRLPARQ